MDAAKVEHFLRTADYGAADDYMNKVEQAYFSDVTVISDELYDHLLNIYEQRFGPRDKIGHLPTHNRVDLPVPMSGLNRVVDDRELQRYASKIAGPYVISDKIDGLSGLLQIIHDPVRTTVVRKMYGRGDGCIGEDISHILSYMTLPEIRTSLLVRGELVLLNSDHDEYFSENINPRTTLGGLIRSNSTDPNGAKLIKFIAYELFVPGMELKPSDQFRMLHNSGFQTPYTEIVTTLDFHNLTDLLKRRKQVVPYKIDGLVINQDMYNTNTCNKNPAYSVKFKQVLHTATAVVTGVKWNASKLGFLRPKVYIQPKNYQGETLTKFTGKSAKFIYMNSIGPGAELLITKGGEIIPDILKVIKPAAVPSMPLDDGSWVWNETGKNIMLVAENDDVRVAKNYEFFKQIGAKFIGKETVEKLYRAGLKTISQILEASPEQLAQAEGIGDRSAARISESIRTSLEQVDLVDIMSASTTFGQGFGKRKLGAIMSAYPNLLLDTFTAEELYNMIIELKGFQEKTTLHFIEGYPKFIEFLRNTPQLYQLVMKLLTTTPTATTPSTSPTATTTPASPAATTTPSTSPTTLPPLPTGGSIDLPKSLQGKRVAVTGTRDAKLLKDIERAGAKIASKVTGTTDMVVNAGYALNTKKATDALRFGTPIITLAEFRDTYLS